ncbi:MULTISPECIES: potassium channel family protein [Enterococcus]|uniref:Trk system potassium uptake protein TrkA n=1 Tax=Enterococcus xiangfangensis TaxID=1296537 RepID=A0ABU3FB64_9ENTE|nr:TrkA family potassium uptake protein [Enterococcus xiangfangensis]MDT2759904.1 TrkA family potassium uptake protein [Enterococcus xiangfangensis]MEE3741683.1 TrkA family potassium uptake protein [Enterococcus faecalis]
MKIIVVGCGRLGSGLASELSRDGNDVTVISSKPELFKKLDADFTGETLTGIEFDKELLEKAGIEKTDSLIGCTESDDINALVARIAKNKYRVPKAIARLYDQRKVDVYNALGIQVIATTKWSIARTKELLTFSRLDSVMTIGNTPVEILRLVIPSLLDNSRLIDAFPLNEIHVVALERENEAFIPSNGTILKQGDQLYVSAMPESLNRIRQIMEL